MGDGEERGAMVPAALLLLLLLLLLTAEPELQLQRRPRHSAVPHKELEPRAAVSSSPPQPRPVLCNRHRRSRAHLNLRSRTNHRSLQSELALWPAGQGAPRGRGEGRDWGRGREPGAGGQGPGAGACLAKDEMETLCISEAAVALVQACIRAVLLRDYKSHRVCGKEAAI
ncbi:hypothetical protein chiPu_0013342 [Chiloscyllium punctatum]|uniref:Uncharacterized protein n=1 Tax=Chiloscyllium punctatum TaxID=137246 RepID=A0A401SWU6_CHIPU|nr:hypothetical protein [Chiloscyllium punctatum]